VAELVAIYDLKQSQIYDEISKDWRTPGDWRALAAVIHRDWWGLTAEESASKLSVSARTAREWRARHAQGASGPPDNIELGAADFVMWQAQDWPTCMIFRPGITAKAAMAIMRQHGFRVAGSIARPVGHQDGVPVLEADAILAAAA
jgi:hypothetical protein